MKKRLFYLMLASISYSLTTCQQTKTEFGVAEKYLPTPELLRNGIVNKYYTHEKRKNSYTPITNVEYRAYFAGEYPNELRHNYYNPAMEITTAKTFKFEDDSMLLYDEQRFFIGDTVAAVIQKNVVRDWQNNTAQLEKTVERSWGSQRWETQQQSSRDTLIEGKTAKIFEGTTLYSQVNQGSQYQNQSKIKEIYVQDIGLYSLEFRDSLRQIKMELVAQIPYEIFRKQQKHRRKRVAYIDPKKVMDKSGEFELCKTNNYIYDYYNGQEEAYHYRGGKKEMWSVIKEHLNEEKLGNESGYLTFRFVVNCKGKAGHYVTEQADLDFQKKQFSDETVAHLFKITRQLTAWNPTKINGDYVDAYFYLTFKLQNGEIIDLLP